MKNFSLLSLLALATVATGNLTAKSWNNAQLTSRLKNTRGDVDSLKKQISIINAKLAAITVLEAKVNSMPKHVDYSSAIAALEAKINSMPAPVDNSSAIAALEAKVQSLQTAVNNMQSSQATASVVATQVPVAKSTPVSSQVSNSGGSDW